MALKLKSSTTTSTSKITRSLKDKVQVIVLMSQGVSARDALQQVFPDTLTPAMESHPHSIVGGYRKSIQKAIEAGRKDVIEALQTADLLEED